VGLSSYKEFSIHPDNLKHIRIYVKIFFIKLKIKSAQIDDLVLVIMEAVSNILKHAYDNKISKDTLKIKLKLEDKNLITVQIFDKGKLIKLNQFRSRNLKDVRAGGLGLFFIGEIMDKIKFMQKNKKWNNHLIISKKITIT